DSSGKTDSAADLEAESTEVRVGTQQPRVSGSSGGRGQELAGDKESADVTGGATVGGGQQRTTGVGGTTRPRRDGGVPAGNFKLTDDVQVGGKAGFEKKARYRDNIAAIKLLKQLEKDSRHATVDEQKVLAKYVGWGGLKEVFKKKVGDNWRAEAAELKELLTAEEYAAARRSMQNAHFTAPSIVKAIWSGIERLGFRGGRITEPSMGSGLFFSLAPDTVRDHPDTRLVGVELDSITGRIAQRLFPNADIRVAGYQELDVPDNSVDLHVSNVPFGAVTIYDRHDKELKRGASIHNFFFEKAIKKTRPGGLVVFLTSRYSLDEHSSADRKRWRELGGDLVGAIRLPGDTFKGIADTSVVTDILIFQKRRAEGKPGGQDFISRGELKQIGYLGFTEEGRTPTRMEGETTFPVNEYFVNNPEHVVGELAWTGTMREKGGLNVERAGVNVAKKIEKAFDEIAERVNADALADGSLLVAPSVVGEASAADWPEDWLRVEGERIFIRQNGKKIEVPAPYLKHEKDKAGDVTTVATSKTAADRYQGLIDVFEAAEKLVALQPNPVASDADVEAARTELNRHYDAFVKKYGPMSAGWNNTFASRSITMLSRLRSIENYDPTENTASKTAIFTRRTERPHVQPIRADGAEQALRLSLAYRGKIDFPYMERLSGLDENRLINELGPAIYSNPETKHWETAEEYLSGNVRQKITAAEAAAKKDNQYSRNVEALTERIPEDKPISKIGANMGSTWIPLADYEAFYEQTFHKNFKFRRALSDNTWVLEGNTRQVTERENVDYGTEERPAFELMERYLNNRDITVRRSSNGVSYVDQEATANAKAKLEALKNKFIEWLWGDTERADRLHRLYNDNYNSDREADWDGSHLTFPGMSDEWRSQLNPHQVNAIWRYIQTGNMLLAHIVGAGKTATMAAMAMEAKRLSGNPHYKTIITVPNHLITSGQFQKEVLEVYPSAKLLAATPDMLSAKGRRTFLKRIASENYDIVVVAHSSFSKIPLDPNYEREFIQQQVADLEQEIRRARADSDRSYEQELEAQKQRLEEKLQKLSNQVSRDANSVYFDQLGVDALFVDEAHLYKNLQVRTRMSRVPGVSTAYSARAFDMWMKTRYFNEKSNYRGLVLATGTPIANSLGELYVMQLYMQPQLLESLGIGSFDAWVANFGEQVTRPEIDPAGGGMRMHSRLARYKNVRDVMAMFRRVADVKLLKHLKSILNRPPMIGGKPQRVEVARNPWLEQYVERLQGRARAVRSGRVDPTEDNMLKIGTDGRKAAFDIRLVDPSAPDLADSKLNRGVENVHRIWKDTAADRLTQLVWIDVTSPENKQPGQLNLYREFVEKLVAKGVPREEIAVIHDYDEKTKPGLFVDMNKGKVRILLGSTDKMGTGVNVQRLLIANHHLDPPAYRPDKVEQRDGRILRRGNLNTKGVHIFQYIAKGSFDARMWDILESKTSFISQAMNGEGEDSLEEDNGEMTAAEMKAAASDNPHLMEYVEVDAAVRQLELERRAFIDEQHSIRSRIKSAEWNRDYKRKTADEYEVFAKEYAAFLESLGDAEIQAKLDDATFTEKKPFGEALLAKINALKDTIKQTGESRNDTFYFKFNGTNGKIWIAYQKYSDSFLVHATLEKGSLRVGDPSLGDSDSGNVTRLLNALQDSTTKPEALRYETEQQAASIIELNKRLGRQWDKTAELEKKTLRRGELFNLTQRDDTLEQEVMRILTSRLGKKVVISDTAKYVYAEDGSDVPEPVRDAALDVANQHRLERRLRELEQQKSHAVVYEWTPPPTPPPKRKGFKKKTATDIQREADDEGDFVEDPGFLGARRRKIRKATIHPSVQFDNPEVEKQIQQSHSVQPKSIKEKIEASLE
ncbi:MAG: DEAD/DEAH box helicase family protein, partial [Pirellulaceae bacterium]|nr:DEAD/DEAH box helicase family protein [Pirellulaceae bacterium]